MDDFNPLVDISEPERIIETFRKYGVVAVTNVLTPQECLETFNDMGLPKECNIDDLSTYNLADAYMNRYGVIGNKPLFTPTLLRNRCHKNVRYVFNLIYGHDKTVVQHDRVAWMRPTAMNQAWDTPYTHPALHLDVNPQTFTMPEGQKMVRKFFDSIQYKDTDDFISENNSWHHTMGTHLQGVINLFDNEEEDGGFHCVPIENCVDWLTKWTASRKWKTKPEVNGRHIFSADELIGMPSYRVPCPAGTMIVFDGCLPHGTRPNRSDKSRAIQFIRYMPISAVGNKAARNKLVRQMVDEVGNEVDPQGFVPDEEQRGALFC